MVAAATRAWDLCAASQRGAQGCLLETQILTRPGIISAFMTGASQPFTKFLPLPCGGKNTEAVFNDTVKLSPPPQKLGEVDFFSLAASFPYLMLNMAVSPNLEDLLCRI